jgi:hypothetical protein
MAPWTVKKSFSTHFLVSHLNIPYFMLLSPYFNQMPAVLPADIAFSFDDIEIVPDRFTGKIQFTGYLFLGWRIPVPCLV